MTIEAMKQELDALYMANTREWPGNKIGAAINALSAAIEEAEKPVAVWELFADGWDSIADPEWMESLPVGTKLYTAPPEAPHQWVGLTDGENDELARTMVKGDKSVNWLVDAIEAKLKEKNHED